MKKTTLLLFFLATCKGFSQIIEHQNFFAAATLGVGYNMSDSNSEQLSDFFDFYKSYEFNAGYRLAFDGNYFIGFSHKKMISNDRSYSTYVDIPAIDDEQMFLNTLKKEVTFTGVTFVYKTKSFFKVMDSMFTLTPSYVALNFKNNSTVGEEEIKANTFGVLLSIQNNYYITENLSIGPKFTFSYAKFNKFESNYTHQINKLNVNEYTVLGADLNLNISYQF